MSMTGAIDRSGPGGAAATGAAPGGDDLRNLAAEFEAMLLGQMLRQMQSSLFGEESETGMSAGPLVDTLFTELALSISRAGGVGVGAALADAMARQAGSVLDTLQSGTLGTTAFATPGSRTGGLEMPWTPAEPAAMAALGGRVSSAYGWRQDPIDATRRFHRGTDIALPEGHDVPAALAGRVTFAGELPGYGLTVTIDHGGDTATRYAHLSSLVVEAGQRVEAGEVIAQSGQTGRATGPHLHFELLEEGEPVNPSALLGRTTNQR